MNECKLLVTKAERNRPHRRPRRIGKDNIKLDLKSVQCPARVCMKTVSYWVPTAGQTMWDLCCTKWYWDGLFFRVIRFSLPLLKEPGIVQSV